jgi:pyrroline-5-carboxylate reductase
MTLQHQKIGFLGGGNMGEAIAGALIHSKIFDRENILVTDAVDDRLEYMAATYGVMTARDNVRLFSECDIVVLAVKPQQMTDVLETVTRSSGYGTWGRTLVISIAAGFPLRKIEALLYRPLDEAGAQALPIIRVMPNTPALVLAGMSGMSPNRHAGEAEIAAAKKILGAMGRVIVFPEEQLDAVTALSGSGPAYVFYLIEAMAQAGVAAGLDPSDASALTLGTLDGAVRLIQASKESPETLRKKVTSPGGTTEAAVNVLDTNNVRRHIVDAILAAARRAEELSR